MHILGFFSRKEEGSAVTIDRYEVSKQNPSAAEVEQNSEEFVTSKSCKVFSHKGDAFRKSE